MGLWPVKEDRSCSYTGWCVTRERTVSTSGCCCYFAAHRALGEVGVLMSEQPLHLLHTPWVHKPSPSWRFLSLE